MPEIKCFKVSEGATQPRKAHLGPFEDAAWDLFYPKNEPAVVLHPGDRKLLGTGLKIILDEGYWAKFHERSGLANKQGISVLGGVIDSGYTGEWKVILVNTSKDSVTIEPGQAICQFTLEEVKEADIYCIDEWEFEEECSVRDRGAKGFGSSDKK